MREIGEGPEADASGSIFYLWEGLLHTRPQWRGSYVRKVIAPRGSIFLVGSGLHNLKLEKAFIEGAAGSAAQLLQTLGKDVVSRAEPGSRVDERHPR
jgi:hypothetical protein